MPPRPGFSWLRTGFVAIAVAAALTGGSRADAEGVAAPRILNPATPAADPGKPPELRKQIVPDPPEPEPEGASADVEDVDADDEVDLAAGEDEPHPRVPAEVSAGESDGDASLPRKLEAPVDGAIPLGEPEDPQDGARATTDMRSPEDVAAFSDPPAGYDPLLFEIEDVEPLSDRRTDRLFRFEPYDPVGIRIGSFVFFPEAEIGTAFTSNVLLSPHGHSDVALELKPSARLVSDWRTHALELRGAADLSYHDDFPSEDDRGYLVEARGRIDMMRRTNVQALIGRSRAQESRSAIDASLIGPRADVDTTTAAMSLNHRFNRLSLQLRAGLVDASYDDGLSGGDLDDRNVTETEQAIRATWELKPSLAIFSEVALDQRDHDVAAFSDGIGRSSDSERYLVGLDFGETGEILRGELSVGWGRQRPDDPRLDDIAGVLVDANLAWRATALTSLLLTARTEFAETTTAGSGGVLVRRVGAEVRHALRRNVIVSAGLAYEWRDYAGVDFDEEELCAALGLEYFLARELALFTRYDHTDFSSTAPAASYNADELRVGMRVRR